MEGIRLGRLAALQKPDGGVREIVVGDIMRRLVARTMAKRVAGRGGESYSPVPVRPDHKRRLRVCCPHSANHHGQG